MQITTTRNYFAIVLLTLLVFLQKLGIVESYDSKFPMPPYLMKEVSVPVEGAYPLGGSSATGSDARDVTCGTNQIDPSMSYRISTPLYNYAPVYPSGFECGWKFLGVGCNPIITCNDNFFLPSSTNCTGTHLHVTDEFLSSGRFCSSAGPQHISTGSSILSAIFVNKFDIPTKGFQCIVTCIHNTGSTDGIHVLEPNLPSSNTLDCSCGIPGKSTSSPSSPDQTNPIDEMNSHRIVGGRPAQPFFYKWQVALMPKTRKSPFCGGSLLNDRFILTAAHCVVTTGLITFPQAADVVLNAYNLKNSSGEPVLRRSVISIYQHPFYDTVGQDYDFAVIEFYPPVDLLATSEPTLTPVCLPPRQSSDSYVGVMGIVSGWGTTSEGGEPASVLQEASIPIISNEDCAKLYSSSEKSQIRITERMLCAAYPEGGIDSCQGDSGGPFVVPDGNGKYHEVGVVSFGEGCARKDKPGVYSRVTIVNDWIRQVAKNGHWCQDS